MTVMRLLPITVTITAAAAAALALAGCSQRGTETYHDAPRSGVTNHSAADVLEFPDGFANVAVKCDGPNRVYVIFHNTGEYGSIAVAPNDPRCTKGAS